MSLRLADVIAYREQLDTQASQARDAMTIDGRASSEKHGTTSADESAGGDAES